MASSALPKIPYRHLGDSGLLVSALSFGSCFTFSSSINIENVYEIMTSAYKAGINFYDNAETYGKGDSEKVMGEVIKLGIERGVWTREDLVISTKIFWGTKSGPNNTGLSRKHIIEGVKASLGRMKLDYVDLIFCHRPDVRTPIQETVRAMNAVIDSGWAFYWGTSEWNSHQIAEACRIADKLNLIRPVMDQPQYNLFERSKVEIEYQPLYKDYKYGLTTWSPLASGVLTGKYSTKNTTAAEGSRLSKPDNKWLRDAVLGMDEEMLEKTDNLRPIAERLNCSLAQLAIAWCVRNENVSTVILGASKVSQLEENIRALEVVPKLTAEVLAEIDDIMKTKPSWDNSMKGAIAFRSAF